MWNGKNGAFKSYATLRVSGDGLKPSTVSEALDLSPSKAEVSPTGFGNWNYSTRDLLDNLRPLEERDQPRVPSRPSEARSSSSVALALERAAHVTSAKGSPTLRTHQQG